MSAFSLRRFISHYVHSMWQFVQSGAFQTRLYVEWFTNGNFCTDVWATANMSAAFCRQITFPLKDSSENICTGTSGNGRKFGISQRDVQWMFFKYFRGMSRVVSLATSKPWHNLWSPAPSGFHYPSSKQIAVLGSQLGCLGWCLSPGIITVIMCFHNMSTTLFHLLTIHLVWCNLNEGHSGGFSYH